MQEDQDLLHTIIPETPRLYFQTPPKNLHLSEIQRLPDSIPHLCNAPATTAYYEKSLYHPFSFYPPDTKKEQITHLLFLIVPIVFHFSRFGTPCPEVFLFSPRDTVSRSLSLSTLGHRVPKSFSFYLRTPRPEVLLFPP